MKLGYILPQIGPAASPDAILAVAKRAEELEYDGLWVTDRLLYPESPQVPYPGTLEGSPFPEHFKTVIDPLHALTYAAAHTSRVTLGTSVLVMSYRNPVMLAKSLASIDVLSKGRLKVGLGVGWSKDELDATGVAPKDRAARADEFLEVLKTIWTTDSAEYHGRFFHLPKSSVSPKPVQKPHPPIYIGAYTPGAMKRAAMYADGFNPAGIPLEGMTKMMDGIKASVTEAGRNASEFKLLVRANLHLTDQPLDEERGIFSGTLDEIKSDIEGTAKLGADELFFDPTHSPEGASLDGHLKTMEMMKRLAGEVIG